MYYNTNKVSGDELQTRTAKAATQEEIVFNIFKKSRRPLTASDVWGMFGTLTNTPLTSIRRAITRLTIEGKVVKTNFKKTGLYGAPEFYYDLPSSKDANKKK